MASSPLYHLLLIFSLFAIGANARPGVHFHPCKTLFISSFTISESFNLQNPNPNQNENPPRFFTIFDFYPTQEPLQIFVNRRPAFDSAYLIPRSIPIRRFEKPEAHHPVVPFDGSFGGSSLRDRTKDILSVVAALLFGVGCGALTSATMYLVWSLVTNRYVVRDGVIYDDDDFSDDDVSPKKMGYCKIPDDVPAAVAPVPAPAKEVV